MRTNGRDKERGNHGPHHGHASNANHVNDHPVKSSFAKRVLGWSRSHSSRRHQAFIMWRSIGGYIAGCSQRMLHNVKEKSEKTIRSTQILR
jgi:hypothetical protein